MLSDIINVICTGRVIGAELSVIITLTLCGWASVISAVCRHRLVTVDLLTL